MHHLPFIRTLTSLIGACLLAGALAACVPVPMGPGRAAFVVRVAPPPPRYEAPYRPPYPAAIWIPGRWVWLGDWQWEGGYWARPPHPHARWFPGHWERRGDDGWVYRPGYWQR